MNLVYAGSAAACNGCISDERQDGILCIKKIPHAAVIRCNGCLGVLSSIHSRSLNPQVDTEQGICAHHDWQSEGVLHPQRHHNGCDVICCQQA